MTPFELVAALMTVVALANALHHGLMSTRFHAEPIVQATELLLQERPPREVEASHSLRDRVRGAAYVRELVPPTPRRFFSPHQAIPQAGEAAWLQINGPHTCLYENELLIESGGQPARGVAA